MNLIHSSFSEYERTFIKQYVIQMEKLEMQSSRDATGIVLEEAARDAL
jgi:hypothetical protein